MRAPIVFPFIQVLRGNILLIPKVQGPSQSLCHRHGGFCGLRTQHTHSAALSLSWSLGMEKLWETRGQPQPCPQPHGKAYVAITQYLQWPTGFFFTFFFISFSLVHEHPRPQPWVLRRFRCFSPGAAPFLGKNSMETPLGRVCSESLSTLGKIFLPGDIPQCGGDRSLGVSGCPVQRVWGQLGVLERPKT